jgi:hypothetical protein
MTHPRDTVGPDDSEQRKKFDPYRYDAGTMSPQLQAELVRMKVPLLADEVLQRPSSLGDSVRGSALRLLSQRWLPVAVVLSAALVSIVLMAPTTPPRSAALAPKAVVIVPVRSVLTAAPGAEPSISIVPSNPLEAPSSPSAAPNRRSTAPSKPNSDPLKPGASNDLEVPFIHL